MDINIQILREAQYSFPRNVTTMISSRTSIQSLLPDIDLIIDCVKWPKHHKDHLICKEDLNLMKKGTVIVDVSADVGGAIETYKHTTHENPTYVVNGVIHYGVDNIPGMAPYTTSIAYAASIFPHILSIANNGIKEGRLATIPGMVPNLIDPPIGCRFANRCPFAIEICTKKTPILKEYSDEHYCACHLLEV